MNWSDIPRNPSQRMLRQFGALGVGACLAMAAAAVLGDTGGTVRAWAWLAAGLSVTVLTLLQPSALRPVFVGWLIVAFPIGWAVGRVALAAMFFGLFTAVGLLFRMMGRDSMTRTRRSGSYWRPRDQATTAADYLRQY